MSGSGWEAFQMFGSGRESLRMSGSGREALPEVQVWSEDPPGCPGVVGRHFQKFESGHEALPKVWEWS